jgi:uncharacterized protein YecE (DUF72 family)
MKKIKKKKEDEASLTGIIFDEDLESNQGRMSKSKGRYYSGISGLQLPIPKYKFPVEHQDSSRLQYYATIFNSIEINSSFYKLPQERTLGKWSESVAGRADRAYRQASFRFTLKFWKEVTHNKGLRFRATDVKRFLTNADKIGPRKGCLLIQLPHSTDISSQARLSRLLKLIRSTIHDDWTIAVEFRHDSWYHDDVYELLNSFNASLVIHDKSKYPSPFLPDLSDTLYIRFHGPSGDYRGSYSDDFLREYSTYIKQWVSEGKTVYVYFNNTMGGGAFHNLVKLNGMVG